ncbi:GTPase-activating protein [Maudiozyma exigua]|uniref:GTPase-activating protein n=1 Tax=Maudiozyma exigua TaxID=34358 RepID=A0A9P6WAX9_MAUEX|nr:GTPase-activating protein [Kazachstania exigua]
MARNNKKKQRNKKNKNSANSSQVDLNTANNSQVELNSLKIDENSIVEDVTSTVDAPVTDNVADNTEKELDLNEEPDLNDMPDEINNDRTEKPEIKANNGDNTEGEVLTAETPASETPMEPTLDDSNVQEEIPKEQSQMENTEQETESAIGSNKEDTKEDTKFEQGAKQMPAVEPEVDISATTEIDSGEPAQIETPEVQQVPEEHITEEEGTVPETIAENEIGAGLPIETECITNKQLAEQENSTLERELNEAFPEEEPDFNISGDISNNDNAESIDNETIDQPKRTNETESTITSSVPALPPRRPEPPSITDGPSAQNNEGVAPPPLPARSSSMEDTAAFIADNTPLNQHSMILNRLDMTIKNLKEEDKFRQKPEEQAQENINVDVDSVWGKIIEDPVTNITEFADNLEGELMKGVDSTLRPQLWNSFTLSYCNDWAPIYKVLAGKPSIENEEALIEQIKEYQELEQADVDAIYNITSALVALDSSIQPTNNSLALAVSIYKVYQNELDSFRIMLTLLKSYDGVALYYENSEALAVLLYQFDRLMEEDCHDLYTHLIKKGLRSSMFATDWFLSSFSKIVPLECAPQILDVVILEGIASLLKFAISLMVRNEDALLKLEFDDLFFYCKNRLFEPYIKGNIEQNDDEESLDDTASVEHKNLTVLTKDNFDVSQFVNDALEKTRINPELLKRYSDEYLEIHRNELAQEEQFQQMRDENTKLQNEVRELEKDYTSLNREHVTIANELLQNQIKIEGVLEANTEMKMEILQLRKQLDTQVKKNNSNSSVLVPNEIQRDLDKTLKKNSKVMQENLIYQDRITALENTISAIKRATAEGIDYDVENGISSGAFKSPLLSGGWTGFKKVFK